MSQRQIRQMLQVDHNAVAALLNDSLNSITVLDHNFNTPIIVSSDSYDASLRSDGTLILTIAPPQPYYDRIEQGQEALPPEELSADKWFITNETNTPVFGPFDTPIEAQERTQELNSQLDGGYHIVQGDTIISEQQANVEPED
jgi:hypothetical protein